VSTIYHQRAQELKDLGFTYNRIVGAFTHSCGLKLDVQVTILAASAEDSWTRFIQEARKKIAEKGV
jgi:hypothetical protein